MGDVLLARPPVVDHGGRLELAHEDGVTTLALQWSDASDDLFDTDGCMNAKRRPLGLRGLSAPHGTPSTSTWSQARAGA